MTSVSDTRERALAASRWLGVRYVVAGLVSLIGTTYLIRTLGEAAWAVYSVGYFLVTFAEQAFGVGLLGALVRDERSPSRVRLRAASSLGQLAGLLSAALLFASAGRLSDWFGDPRLETCLNGVAVAFLIAGLRSPAVAMLERDLRYGWIAVGEVLDNVTFLIVAVLCLEAGLGFDSVAAGLAARNLPSALMLIRAARCPLRGSTSLSDARDLAAFGVPAMAFAVFFLLNGLVPALILGGDHARELAFFMTTGSIIGYAAVTQVVVQRIGFPAFAALRTQPAAMSNAVARTLRLSSFLLVAAVLPVATTSPIWLEWLFGAGWQQAGIVMAWLGAGLVIHGIAGVFTAALNATGDVRGSFYSQAFSTLLYLALAFVLTRQFDWLTGAPIALAASRAAAVAYLARRLGQTGMLPPLRASSARVLAATAAMVVLTEVVSHVTWAVSITAALCLLWSLSQRDCARLLWAIATPLGAGRRATEVESLHR